MLVLVADDRTVIAEVGQGCEEGCILVGTLEAHVVTLH